MLWSSEAMEEGTFWTTEIDGGRAQNMRRNSRCRSCGSERKLEALEKGVAGESWRCQMTTHSQFMNNKAQV